MSDQSLDESALTVGTTSPFLPGTQIQYAWDSTSLGYLKTCPRLYQYVMIEGWSSLTESIHLRFGMEYHQALQDYDIARANGDNHDEATFAAMQRLAARTHDWIVDPDSKAGKYKNRETLYSLVIDYLDHYKDDPAETYIKSDGTPAVELSFRFELNFGPTAPEAQSDNDNGTFHNQPYLLCGHLDRVVSFNDQLFVMDHKTTTTTLSDYYFSQYEPNNQMTLYTLAGSIILAAPIKGVFISGAQIMLSEPHRFVRRMTYRTQDQLEEWLDSLRVLLAQAETYAESGFWPMNDTACDKFGGCRFRSVCSKSPSVREIYLKSDFVKLEEKDRWNPLSPR